LFNLEKYKISVDDNTSNKDHVSSSHESSFIHYFDEQEEKFMNEKNMLEEKYYKERIDVTKLE